MPNQKSFGTLRKDDKNIRPYVISVDWLSVSVEVTEAFFSSNPVGREAQGNVIVQPSGYAIEKKGQGTKQWANIAECFEPDGTLIGTLTWQPRNPAQNQRSGIFKLENSVLYEGEAYERAVAAVIGLGLRYKSLSRLDLACDFNEFYSGLLPQNFIDRAHRGDFIKVGLARAYEHIDFTYHAYERNGSLQMLTPSMSEAEQDFYQLVISLTTRKKKLPQLEQNTLTHSEAVALIAQAETSDTTTCAPLVAAVSLRVPNCNVVELCREAFVIIRNKEIQSTGLAPLEYVPSRPVTSKPKPRHDSLTFGRAGKAVQCIIYNKTRELREVKMKKYIVETWQRAGIDIKRDVWRVEIRIQGAGQELQNLENGTYARLSCNDLEFQSQIEQIYKAYAEKYFKWYTWDEQHVKVQNMQRTQLFCFVDPPIMRPKRIKKAVSPTRSTKMVVNALSRSLYACKDEFHRHILRKARGYFETMYDLGDYLERLDYEAALGKDRLFAPEPLYERRERLFAGSTDGHRLAAGDHFEMMEKRRMTLKEWAKQLYKDAIDHLREREEKERERQRVNEDALLENIIKSDDPCPWDSSRIEWAYDSCIESILQPPTDLIQCPF